MSITDSDLFKHDEFLRTPLGNILLYLFFFSILSFMIKYKLIMFFLYILANAIINENEEEIKLLLNNGSSKTMFVKGYSESSIVCTLPQVKQPQSRCFNHPEPFEKSSSKVMDILDTSFSKHIEDLVKKTIDEKVEKSKSISSIVSDDDNFDKFHIKLKKNDRVERGPQWKSTSDEDANGEGTVISDDKHPTYLVNWDNNRKDIYIYDPAAKTFEVQIVDPSKSTSKLTAELFQVGDIVSVNFDSWNNGYVTTFGS
jgi:hypothetical protein